MQGSINQTDIDSASSAMQCTCIAAAFVCASMASSFRSLSTLTEEIDHIVHKGTDLYNMHIAEQFDGNVRYLMIDELPKTVSRRGTRYILDYLDVFSGTTGNERIAEQSVALTLEDSMLKAFETVSACFLTLSSYHSPGFTIAIRKFEDTCFWSCDSHSRNEKGAFCAAGKAVIMELP